jgi:2-methylcitrate dehydratase
LGLTSIARTLVDYSLKFRFEGLPDKIVARTKQAVLDTLGCAIAGYESESSRIVQEVIGSWGGPLESTVFGSGLKTSCFNTVLANGVMVRYLDFNDTITRPRAKGTHPSELIPMVLALSEKQNSTGKDVITAIALGYELLGRFVMGQAETVAGSSAEGQYGWANSIWFPYVLPILAGRFLGLNEDQTVNAISLCGIQNLTLGIIDAPGELYNMAKNIQVPFIAQSAIEVACLAKEGYTGPERVIEGNKAFYELVLRKEYDLDVLTKDLDGFKFDASHVIKRHSAETGIQATIDAVLELVKEHQIGPDDVESVRVHTNRKAFLHTSDPVKRHPTNKETADHSHAYTVAVAITDGRVGPEQYAAEKLRDPKINELVDKVTIEPEPEFENIFPASTVDIKTKSGKTYSCKITAPKGAPSNPMTDEELKEKFRSLATNRMSETQTDDLIATIYDLEKLNEIDGLTELLVWDRR